MIIDVLLISAYEFLIQFLCYKWHLQVCVTLLTEQASCI